jgi:putative oxidoreductase
VSADVMPSRRVGIIALLGRILFGGFFLSSGVNHFLNVDTMAGYAASKGVPLPTLGVLLSGAMILVGGAMILLGWKTRIGAWLIVLFLIPVSVMMHNFWTLSDPALRMADQVNFMKNIALVGAALMIAAVPRWHLSLERPRPRLVE